MAGIPGPAPVRGVGPARDGMGGGMGGGMGAASPSSPPAPVASPPVGSPPASPAPPCPEPPLAAPACSPRHPSCAAASTGAAGGAGLLLLGFLALAARQVLAAPLRAWLPGGWYLADALAALALGLAALAALRDGRGSVLVLALGLAAWSALSLAALAPLSVLYGGRLVMAGLLGWAVASRRGPGGTVPAERALTWLGILAAAGVLADHVLPLPWQALQFEGAFATRAISGAWWGPEATRRLAGFGIFSTDTALMIAPACLLAARSGWRGGSRQGGGRRGGRWRARRTVPGAWARAPSTSPSTSPPGVPSTFPSTVPSGLSAAVRPPAPPGTGRGGTRPAALAVLLLSAWALVLTGQKATLAWMLLCWPVAALAPGLAVPLALGALGAVILAPPLLAGSAPGALAQALAGLATPSLDSRTLMVWPEILARVTSLPGALAGAGLGGAAEPAKYTDPLLALPPDNLALCLAAMAGLPALGLAAVLVARRLLSAGLLPVAAQGPGPVLLAFLLLNGITANIVTGMSGALMLGYALGALAPPRGTGPDALPGPGRLP